MIRKSGLRFSEKIMLKQKMTDEHDSTQLKHALDFFVRDIWKHLLMQHAVRRSIPIALLALLIPLACASGLAYAQSGSASGSIGNDEKSLSGSPRD
jgi:hypothetical protein